MATDEQLIQQIQKGQSEAYGQLFSKYYQPIYSVCFAILRNPQDAEEVTSETFVHAYLKLAQLRKPSQFFFWLKRIAQNRSKNFLRDKPKETTSLDLASVQTKAQIAPDALLLRQELIDAIMEAIESLPPNDRKVIRAHIDGLNHSQISEQLGISIEASKSRLYRVRKKVAEYVKDLLNAIVFLPKTLPRIICRSRFISRLKSVEFGNSTYKSLSPFKKIVSGGIEAMKIGTSTEVTTGILTATQSLMFSVIFHIALFIALSFFLPYKFHSDRRKVDAYLEVSFIPTEEQQPMFDSLSGYFVNRQRPSKGTAKSVVSVKTSFSPIKTESPSKAPRGFLSAKKPASQGKIGEAVVSQIGQAMRKLRIGTGVSVKGGERILDGKREEMLSSIGLRGKSVLAVGENDVALTNGVGEIAKGRSAMDLEITKAERFKSVSSQRRKFGKRAGLSMVGDVGVADADDTLANVAKDMILDRTGFSVPELPKGEPGGVIIGRGKDMKGRLRLGMLSCSMVDKRYAQGFAGVLNYWIKWINANTNIKVDINVEGGAIRLTDANLLKCPILFLFGYNEGMHSIAGWYATDPTLTGKNRWTSGGQAANHLSSIEQQKLRKYLVEKGGVLFVDTLPQIISSYYGNQKTLGPPYPWSTRMKRELQTILPEYNFQKIPNKHPLYHSFYDIGGMPPGLPKTKSGTDVASAFFGFLFSPSAYLQGISIDDKLAVIYSENALALIANNHGNFDYLSTRAAFNFLTNVVVYGLTHSGISDKSRYVPAKEIQESAEEIPKNPPIIPSPTPNSRP